MKMPRFVLFLMLLLSAGLIGVPSAQAATLSGACSGNASGDFNGDGWDDLAVGTPDEDTDGKNNAGGVDVFYGSDTGLSDDLLDPQFITQESPGIAGGSENGDQFGGCVVAGDFDGDAVSDLAISAPGEDFTSKRGSFDATGVVHIIYGSDDEGLDGAETPAAQLWHQDAAKIPGANEDDDEFGAALAAGDFDGDEIDDLAIGTPKEAIGTRNNAGAVVVLFGGGAGATGTGAELWHQSVTGVAGTSEKNDRFGAALTSGDIDGTGRDDLVAGIPGEAVSRTVNSVDGGAGAIQTFLGTAKGLTAIRDRIWHQDSTGVLGTAEDDDRFGTAVAAGDFDGDGFDDVAVGVPSEDDDDEDDGVIQSFYGTETGITGAGDQMFGADDLGGAFQLDAFFGAALSTLDFNEDTANDLAIGAPGEDSAALAAAAGVVYTVEGVEDAGLDSVTGAFFDQDAIGDGDGAEEDEAFGASLTSGNYDGSDEGAGLADLAIGVPLNNDVAEPEAGAVNVVYSDGAVLDVGLTDQFLDQSDGDGDNDGPNEEDHFGSAIG